MLLGNANVSTIPQERAELRSNSEEIRRDLDPVNGK